jgi:NAD(P)-dependent dehydrogenase (short-subunit alcohol dehydrogenase family)
MRVMAHEWADRGITVNAIAPGYIETPLTKDYLDQANTREKLSKLVPYGRLGSVEEVVGPTLFLCSDLAKFITGHVLYVDGGRTLV